MDEKTLQALTALADKLGTTAEYLWGVLLKQAPITGALSLLMMAAWVAVCVLLVRYVKRKTAGEEPEWDDEVTRAFAWAGTVCLCAIAALVITIAFSDAITALVNPEYWALRQILK